MSEEVLDNAIINPHPDSIVLKSTRTFYQALAPKLKEGSRVFIKGIGRKQAHYAKKRLSKLSGDDIAGFPVQVNGVDGYLFQPKKGKKK